MQKFVRPQELVNYKIKKVINLSRFARPILAVAIRKVKDLVMHAPFGAEAYTGSCAWIWIVPFSFVIHDVPN